jgi:Tol biopolymer transport system component
VADGTKTVRIADGVPGPAGNCFGYWGEGPIWSPDGRYLAFRGDGGKGLPDTCDRTVNIRDATGKRLSSFPAEGWAISWSPDSTRVAAWIDFSPGTMIGIYGIDGERQALVTVPPGLTWRGDFDPLWAPDGASLLVPFGVEIPVDGSPPRQLPEDDPRSQWRATNSPDGTQLAFISRDEFPHALCVAAADGSHPRVLDPRGVENAVWSPTGDRIAFASVMGGRTVDVDPATQRQVALEHPR